MFVNVGDKKRENPFDKPFESSTPQENSDYFASVQMNLDNQNRAKILQLKDDFDKASYEKARYSEQEIYDIDYDYKEMGWQKYPMYPIEKLISGHMWLKSIFIDMPEDLSAGATVKYLNENYSDEQLFKAFEDMAGYVAMGELEQNIISMIHKFKRNEGGIYESELLTKYIEKHESTNTYCEELQDYIAEKLKNSKGKLSDLIENEVDFKYNLRPRRKKEKTTTRINKGKEAFFIRPQFDNFSDAFTGEQISLNDIWATEVKITDYKLNGKEYTIKYDVTLWDHFGLDKPDLEKWFNILPKVWLLFTTWFTLQHLRGYKPFITKIQFSKEFTGKLSEGKYERVKKRIKK